MFEHYPDLLTANQVADALRVGRNMAYELIKSGQIKSLYITEHCIRVPKLYLEEYVLRGCGASSQESQG